ncbi:MAG: RNA-binding protein [Chloroflexi bacterium]|nr:RNA-binding protein [Chloroflexota bacterium]
MATKLYVGNLSYDTTESQLEALFGQAGSVIEVAIIQDRYSGRSKGFGFVEMDDASAADAIQRFNGTELDGRTIKVDKAQPRQSRDTRRESRW